MNKRKQADLAAQFHALHHAEETLLLPNAWDCASAKIFEMSGFPAIATTSCGISWAFGFQDGEHLPPALMVQVLQRIAASVNVPVTADIEGGYFKNDLEKMAQFIAEIIDAGVVGINLEDVHNHATTLNNLEHQVKAIQTAKAVGKQKEINLFVNARTDVMMLAEAMNVKLEICLERAKAFADAGADGVFVPFVNDVEIIKTLKEHISLPLNILIADTLDIPTLKKLKIDRVSVGGRPMLATMNFLKKTAKELRQEHNWNTLFTAEPTYQQMNNWFE